MRRKRYYHTGNFFSVIFFNGKIVSSRTTFVQSGESYYADKETLLGAIFTDDIETYNCFMGKVFKKLDIVTKIYKRKTGELVNAYSDNQICFNIHYGSGEIL